MQYSDLDLAFVLLLIYSVAVTVLLFCHWANGRWFKKAYINVRANQDAAFQKAVESQFSGEVDWKKRSQLMPKPKPIANWVGKLKRNEERVVIKADFRNKTKWEPGNSGPKGAA